VTDYACLGIAVDIRVTAAEENSAQVHAWTRLWTILLPSIEENPAAGADTETGLKMARLTQAHIGYSAEVNDGPTPL
jgi:hypothetical protein